MDLSIIIVNWNSAEYLRKCIASILALTSGITYEIVVIDSASFDGAGQMLKQFYPHVRFIQSDRNVGFAKANNTAFKVSEGSHILFLNPDTELVVPAINVMFDYMQKLPKTGALGCKLINADGSVQTTCIQSFPTILNQLLSSEFLRALFPKSSLWGMASLFGAEKWPAEVEVLSGACLMVRRTLFEQVGLFSEEYFMYAEDLDLCYKIRQAGFINYYIPEAAVIHFGGGSTDKGHRDFSAVMMRESIWRFLRKTRGRAYGLAYRTSMLISAIGRLIVLMIALPISISGIGRVSWKASFRKWRAILAWSLGLEDAAINRQMKRVKDVQA
jgi:N-acetylglucosaminyl-diphospho-decaprenol L-rhamnosyltransferase